MKCRCTFSFYPISPNIMKKIQHEYIFTRFRETVLVEVINVVFLPLCSSV